MEKAWFAYLSCVRKLNVRQGQKNHLLNEIKNKWKQKAAYENEYILRLSAGGIERIIIHLFVNGTCLQDE